MTVFVGTVKEHVGALQAATAVAGNLGAADNLSIAGINKALRDLGGELDLRVGELDAEIAGGADAGAFSLPEDSDAIGAIARINAEAANIVQMTQLLDVRAYAGRIDRLMDQVR